MKFGGYANRIAHIDLTGGEVQIKSVPEEWAVKYIGGRGLGVKYVFENGPEVDPLSPENILCFMNGPLTGTEVNLSGRLAVVTKSPLTGTITDSHHGGWSAARHTAGPRANLQVSVVLRPASAALISRLFPLLGRGDVFAAGKVNVFSAGFVCDRLQLESSNLGSID